MKKLFTALLTAALLVGTLVVPAAAAENDEITKSIEGVTRNAEGEFYAEFDSEIEEGGVTYKLSDVKYNEDPVGADTQDVSSEEILSTEDFDPDKELVINGRTYAVKNVTHTENVITGRTETGTVTVERDDMEKDKADEEADATVTDPVTGEEVTAKVAFKESNVVSGEWKADFTAAMVFDTYDADYFEFEGELYAKDETTPLPADAYAAIVSYLGLTGSRYRVTGIAWSGDSYESDGVVMRNAAATGDSYHQKVEDTYEGEIELSDLTYYTYTVTYEETETSVKTRQTATAVATYKAVVEETTAEETTEEETVVVPAKTLGQQIADLFKTPAPYIAIGVIGLIAVIVLIIVTALHKAAHGSNPPVVTETDDEDRKN